MCIGGWSAKLARLNPRTIRYYESIGLPGAGAHQPRLPERRAMMKRGLGAYPDSARRKTLSGP
jgi:hypothetical protein